MPRMRQVLEMVGLWERSKQRLWATFSGGMKRIASRSLAA